jgi:two-component system sensor histidine kinase PilS (NtrC family)
MHRRALAGERAAYEYEWQGRLYDVRVEPLRDEGGVTFGCIGLAIDITDDLLVVFDRGHLNQIFWNLVRNAWQHCQKREGSIRIAARAGYMGDAVICELADDGPGVPSEFRAQIFEPFFTTRPGGTGLGLYIARELADANGAALELLPKSPGAVFRMTFKRALTPASAAQMLE